MQTALEPRNTRNTRKKARNSERHRKEGKERGRPRPPSAPRVVQASCLLWMYGKGEGQQDATPAFNRPGRFKGLQTAAKSPTGKSRSGLLA